MPDPLSVTPPDQELTFFLETYRNAPLADWCLGNVRRCYPGSRIVLISDGDPDPEYRSMGDRHSVDVTYGERHWPAGGAGRLWTRRFRAFLAAPTEYLLKIDTDTGFYHRLSGVPADESLFGTIGHHPRLARFVQGGFIGMTAGAARRLAESGLMETDFAAGFHWEDGRGGTISSDDLAVSAVAERLGIPLVAHPEVASRWRIRMDNADLKFAVVHPCKNGQL